MWLSQKPRLHKRKTVIHVWLPTIYLSFDHLKLQSSCLPGIMEKVQYLTRSAIRRASTIEMPPQARQNLQNLFINFCLILICLLLICIIVMLLWSFAAISRCTTCQLTLKSSNPWRGEDNTAYFRVECLSDKSRLRAKQSSKCIHLLDLVNKHYSD